MSLTSQELIVGAIIAVAAAYLAWRLILAIKRRSGCGSCGSCGTDPVAQKPLVQLNFPPKSRKSP
jgi:hypothetical protein